MDGAMLDPNGSMLQVVTTSASHGKRVHILTQFKRCFWNIMDCAVTSDKFNGNRSRDSDSDAYFGNYVHKNAKTLVRNFCDEFILNFWWSNNRDECFPVP
jgi:hypothetical protein